MKFRGSLLLTAVLVSAIGVVVYPQARDYSRYEIEVTLDTKAHTLTGIQKLEYLNDTGQPLDTITFILFANTGRKQNPYIHPALQDPWYLRGFDPTWTKILSVTDGAGQPLKFQLEALPPFLITFSLEEVLLRVHLPQPIEPGGRTTVVIGFETKFTQALIADNNIYRGIYTWRFAWNPMAYPPKMLEEERLELPAAFYRVKLKVPKGFVVAAGVEHQEVIAQDDRWQTLLLESGVPTRSVPLVIGKGLEHYRLNYRDIVIDSYYLPGGEGYGRLAAAYAAEILEYYTKHFGPYGYKRLVIVENPTPGFFGMAADAMILIGAGSYLLKDMPIPGVLDRLLEFLIAHEVGHLWWGIGVGADFNAENWLSEAFANYLAITYFEEKHGGFEPNLFAHLGNGLLEWLIKSQFGYYNFRRHWVELPYLWLLRNRFDEAIVKSRKETEYLNGYAVRIYKKGYLVLRALEGLLGREMMLKILQEAYNRYRHLIPRVEDFRRVAEELSGQDLKAFFDSWLYGADFIDVAIERVVPKKTAGGYETAVYLSKQGKAVLPVTIVAETIKKEKLEQIWQADAERGMLTFMSQAPVRTVQLDPQEQIPDVNRYNNHYPPRLVVKFGESDLPLDAYFLRVDPLSLQGGFRTDHRWGVSLMPRLKAERARLLWDGVAFLLARLDRGLSLSGLLSIEGYDPDSREGKLNGELSLNKTYYEHPAIGFVGRYWYPANRLSLSVGVQGTLAQPLGYLGADLVRDDILKLYMLNRFSIRAGLLGQEPFVRLEWDGFERFRLAHLLYLDARLKLGTGLQSLPEPFKFKLEELEVFREKFQNDAKIFGRLDLVLLPLRHLDYSVLNLMLIHELRPAVFVQGGQTWPHGVALQLNGLKAEAGIQVTISIRSFLGLPLALTVGYAHPILGAAPDTPGRIFFKLR